MNNDENRDCRQILTALQSIPWSCVAVLMMKRIKSLIDKHLQKNAAYSLHDVGVPVPVKRMLVSLCHY